MKLILVRHLPTAWNREGKLQGRRDTDIDPPEPAVCAEIARTLAGHGPFDHVACSSLRRTRQTAEAFGFPNAESDPLLDELAFGEWEGRPRADMLAAHGDAWHARPDTLVFGEPVAALADRVRAFVEKHRAHRSVLAFGHGGWIRAARALHATGSITTMNLQEIRNSEVLLLDWE